MTTDDSGDRGHPLHVTTPRLLPSFACAFKLPAFYLIFLSSSQKEKLVRPAAFARTRKQKQKQKWKECIHARQEGAAVAGRLVTFHFRTLVNTFLAFKTDRQRQAGQLGDNFDVGVPNQAPKAPKAHAADHHPAACGRFPCDAVWDGHGRARVGRGGACSVEPACLLPCKLPGASL